MSVWVKLILFVSVALVLLVLIAGIINLLSRSPHQASRSNMFMRWRVGLQFVAILLLLIASWLWV